MPPASNGLQFYMRRRSEKLVFNSDFSWCERRIPRGSRAAVEEAGAGWHTPRQFGWVLTKRAALGRETENVPGKAQTCPRARGTGGYTFSVRGQPQGFTISS